MKNNNAVGGIGFTGLLQIVFITLKLCHVINWSWWWVLSPVWIPIGISIVVVTVMFLYMVIH